MADYKTGRPPKFTDPKEMQKKVDEYFNTGVEETEVLYGSAKDGVHRERVKVPTITGLALYLGFCSRASFYEYEQKEEFADTIKKARSKMEMIYEQQLRYGNVTGAIFALKNFGWTDRKEIEIETKLSEIPKEDLEKQIELKEKLIGE